MMTDRLINSTFGFLDDFLTSLVSFFILKRLPRFTHSFTDNHKGQIYWKQLAIFINTFKILLVFINFSPVIKLKLILILH